MSFFSQTRMWDLVSLDIPPFDSNWKLIIIIIAIIVITVCFSCRRKNTWANLKICALLYFNSFSCLHFFFYETCVFVTWWILATIAVCQCYTDYRTISYAKCTDKQLKSIRLNLYNFDIFGRQSALIRELEKYRNLMIVFNNFVFFIFFLYLLLSSLLCSFSSQYISTGAWILALNELLFFFRFSNLQKSTVPHLHQHVYCIHNIPFQDSQCIYTMCVYSMCVMSPFSRLDFSPIILINSRFM